MAGFGFPVGGMQFNGDEDMGSGQLLSVVPDSMKRLARPRGPRLQPTRQGLVTGTPGQGALTSHGAVVERGDGMAIVDRLAIR